MRNAPPAVLAVSNASLLRWLAANPGAKVTWSAIGDAIDRDGGNVAKSVASLRATSFVAADSLTLTDAGRALLPGLDVLDGMAPAPVGEAPDLVGLRHDQLEPDPENPRQAFDPNMLDALAADIAARDGKVLQNLVVHKAHGGDRFRIAAGERRWRAVGLLIGRGEWDAAKPLPCRVLPLADALQPIDLRYLALSENLQRADLSPMEMARTFQALVDDGETPPKIADRIGRSARFVQQRLQLLQLPDAVQVRLGPQAEESERLTIKEALALVQEKKAPASAPVTTVSPNPQPASRTDRLPLGGTLSPRPQASGVRFSNEALDRALSQAERLVLAEVAWVARGPAGALAWAALRPGQLDSDGMVRCVPAPRAHEHALTAALIGGRSVSEHPHGKGESRVVPFLHLIHDPKRGPVCGLTYEGRRALHHFAPALPDLDSRDADALRQLDEVREGKVAKHDRQLLLERGQMATAWLNDSAVSEAAEPAEQASGTFDEEEVDAGDLIRASEIAERARRLAAQGLHQEAERADFVALLETCIGQGPVRFEEPTSCLVNGRGEALAVIDHDNEMVDPIVAALGHLLALAIAHAAGFPNPVAVPEAGAATLAAS